MLALAIIMCYKCQYSQGGGAVENEKSKKVFSSPSDVGELGLSLKNSTKVLKKRCMTKGIAPEVKKKIQFYTLIINS
jgi:hypothetical protein